MSDPIAEAPPAPAIIDRDQALVLARREGQPMLERWIEQDVGIAIQRIEAMVDVLNRLRILSIRATYPSDWLIHVSRDDQGTVLREAGYLQDVGAERAAKPWGVEVRSPIWQREPVNGFLEDGTFIYHCEAEAFSKVTGEHAEIRGSKWSGEPFFARRAESGPDGQVDPTDVSKAAYSNLHGRAVRALCGLNAVPLDRLEAAGLDLSKVLRIGYAKGGQGGQSTGAQVGTSDLVIAWGSAKGKKLPELDARDLTYYTAAYTRDVADPNKERFKKNNTRMLEGLTAEAERRTRATEQERAPEEAPAEAPTTRGQMIAALWAALNAAAGDDQKLVMALLKQLTGGVKASLSDLSDEELRQLGALDEERLRELVKTVKASTRPAA